MITVIIRPKQFPTTRRSGTAILSIDVLVFTLVTAINITQAEKHKWGSRRMPGGSSFLRWPSIVAVRSHRVRTSQVAEDVGNYYPHVNNGKAFVIFLSDILIGIDRINFPDILCIRHSIQAMNNRPGKLRVVLAAKQPSTKRKLLRFNPWKIPFCSKNSANLE